MMHLTESTVESVALAWVESLGWVVRRGPETAPDGLFAERKDYREVVWDFAGERTMKYDPEKHHRRSIRLKGYDYRQTGAYFVTICTQNRACLFCKVVDGEMRLNEAGQMVLAEWNVLPERFPMVELDAFVVMPNHTHGIIVITNDIVGAGLVPAQNDAGLVPAPAPERATKRVPPTLGDVVGAFKSRTTVLYASGVKQLGWTPFPGRLWQRNYYERIICDEESLNRIRRYILQNPVRWTMDRENPQTIYREREGPWHS